MSFWTTLSSFFGLAYKDQVRPSGLTNFHTLLKSSVSVAGIYRTGLPTTPASVADLRNLVGRGCVVRLSLHDAAEGSEAWVATLPGWSLVEIPLYPEDDRPWTVLLRPSKADVERAVATVLEAHAHGSAVVFGCVHDRERGGLIAALVGGKLFGWSRQQQIDYMVETGSRILVTPGLLEFYLTEP